jgi:hypothetical protein
MDAHLRIARPVSDLARAVRLYKLGLSLDEIASFEDHDGFDGVMLGNREGQYHFEFTYCRRHPVRPSPTPEDLLVFYVQDHGQWVSRCESMRQAGFTSVQPFNGYWARLGCTFEDFDGYRLVIQRAAWANG